MMYHISSLFALLLRFGRVAHAAVLRPRSSPPDDQRSWEAAVQNINGMNSILTLLPVLTGRAQNIKLVASRILPGSFIIAGIGAGRVLAKLQVGILLCSFDLYCNTVGELSYPHDEYVNKFSPKLDHVPTNTPERHAKGAHINHNPAEAYMIEAWFRTQGFPAVVELRQNNTIRMIFGFTLYLCLYAGETYLAAKIAATDCSTVFLLIQALSVCLWLLATIIVQVRKGQGQKKLELNDTESSEYRCFQLPLLGKHVSTALLSFHLNSLQQYQIFQSNYKQPALVLAGSLIMISGVLDILSTVLIVGLTVWAYPWLAVQLLVILAKVVFCVEPTRQMEIHRVKRRDTGEEVHLQMDGPLQVPLHIEMAEQWSCCQVTTHYNIFRHRDTAVKWRSASPGVYIGQPYTSVAEEGKRSLKYLAFTGDSMELGLVDVAPAPQTNEALQREFLAAMVAVVAANKIPSREFIAAVETGLASIKANMPPHWFRFGAKDVNDAIASAKATLIWREWL